MTEISEKGRKMMQVAIDEAYLLALNRYAFEHELISEDAFRRLEVMFKMDAARKINELMKED